jgi:hypothetical protein
LKKLAETNDDYFPLELRSDKPKKRTELTYEGKKYFNKEKFNIKINSLKEKSKNEKKTGKNNKKGDNKTEKKKDNLLELNRRESIDITEVIKKAGIFGDNKNNIVEDDVESEKDNKSEVEDQDLEDDFMHESDNDAGDDYDESEGGRYSDGGVF